MRTIDRIMATGKVRERDGITPGVWHEPGNGWFAAFLPGWRRSDELVHHEHAHTLGELLARVREAVPCTCDVCMDEMAEGGAS